MRHMSGDLFTTECVALGHGVNIRGLMGAGVAKGFKAKYGVNYLSYGQQCKVKGLIPGQTLIVPCQELDINSVHIERAIVNMASQDEPGANARYDWLFTSALSAAEQLMEIGITKCAIPEIGCGIGGLAWPQTQTLLEAVEILVPGFEWEVWHYEVPTIVIDKE